MAGFLGREDGPTDLLVIPHPAVSVAVRFGGQLVVEDAEGRRLDASVASALVPRALRVRASGLACVQARLSPLAARAILGVSPAELGHGALTLTDLWGPAAARLEERVREAATWQARFALVDAELGARATAGRPVSVETAFAWRRIRLSRGLLRIERLADELGWSRRRLWSRFRAEVGLSPKRAAGLVRFDHAAHRLAEGANPATTAADGGYADQSHLHREIRSFASLTPAAIAGQPWLAVDDLAWPPAQR